MGIIVMANHYGHCRLILCPGHFWDYKARPRPRHHHPIQLGSEVRIQQSLKKFETKIRLKKNGDKSTSKKIGPAKSDPYTKNGSKIHLNKPTVNKSHRINLFGFNSTYQICQKKFHINTIKLYKYISIDK